MINIKKKSFVSYITTIKLLGGEWKSDLVTSAASNKRSKKP